MKTATVKYQVATYEGEIQVSCQHDDENETIIARAKAKLTRQVGFLPYGYQSWSVVSVED